MLSAMCFNLDQSTILFSGYGLILYHIDFLTPKWLKTFENIVKNEKRMLLSSIFSFSHNVFYTIK